MRALVTGCSGQDGSFLCDQLVKKGYEVHGVVRRYSRPYYPNIQHLLDKEAITLHEADLSDLPSLEAIVHTVKPDEVYNLGSMSHVGTSFAQPELTLDVTGLGAWRLLEAVRRHSKHARFYQASSSEMFGNSISRLGLERADERTPMEPVSPYGSAKLLAHHMVRIYRESYGMFVSSGILFNHESQYRGSNFLTRKVTLGLARIANHRSGALRLGNLNAVRDWGYAPEYTDAMWRMLQYDKPGEWVIATGQGHSIQDFLDASIKEVRRRGIDLPENVATSSPNELRPMDIHWLVGDASKAATELGWRPQTDFEGLVRIMVGHDLEQARREALHEANA